MSAWLIWDLPAPSATAHSLACCSRRRRRRRRRAGQGTYGEGFSNDGRVPIRAEEDLPRLPWHCRHCSSMTEGAVPPVSRVKSPGHLLRHADAPTCRPGDTVGKRCEHAPGASSQVPSAMPSPLLRRSALYPCICSRVASTPTGHGSARGLGRPRSHLGAGLCKVKQPCTCTYASRAPCITVREKESSRTARSLQPPTKAPGRGTSPPRQRSRAALPCAQHKRLQVQA